MSLHCVKLHNFLYFTPSSIIFVATFLLNSFIHEEKKKHFLIIFVFIDLYIIFWNVFWEYLKQTSVIFMFMMREGLYEVFKREDVHHMM